MDRLVQRQSAVVRLGNFLIKSDGRESLRREGRLARQDCGRRRDRTHLVEVVESCEAYVSVQRKPPRRRRRTGVGVHVRVVRLGEVLDDLVRLVDFGLIGILVLLRCRTTCQRETEEGVRD